MSENGKQRVWMPRPVRHAAICTDEKCLPPIRVFLATREAAEAWRCPEHGRGVVQENRPYTKPDV